MWSPLYVVGLVGSDEHWGGEAAFNEGEREAMTLQARSFVRVDASWNVTSLVSATASASTAFTTVEGYEYDPYGRVTYLSGSFGVLTASAFGQRYLYQGGRLDEVTGLYSFRRREYDPGQGRWKQADPAGYVDGGSLYEYLWGSPVFGVDPSGLARKCPNCEVSVPRQGYVPIPNGCTGAPNFPVGGANFTFACNNHDICYGTCNATRLTCDADFATDLAKACAAAHPPGWRRTICNSIADDYIKVVSNLGLRWYDNGQDEACVCARPPMRDLEGGMN